LKLQNNSTFGVEVNSKAYSYMYTSNFKEFGYSTSVTVYLVSTLITAVESNLRPS